MTLTFSTPHVWQYGIQSQLPIRQYHGFFSRCGPNEPTNLSYSLADVEATAWTTRVGAVDGSGGTTSQGSASPGGATSACPNMMTVIRNSFNMLFNSKLSERGHKLVKIPIMCQVHSFTWMTRRPTDKDTLRTRFNVVLLRDIT
jgi:hypothetical protein